MLPLYICNIERFSCHIDKTENTLFHKIIGWHKKYFKVIKHLHVKLHFSVFSQTKNNTLVRETIQIPTWKMFKLCPYSSNEHIYVSVGICSWGFLQSLVNYKLEIMRTFNTTTCQIKRSCIRSCGIFWKTLRIDPCCSVKHKLLQTLYLSFEESMKINVLYSCARVNNSSASPSCLCPSSFPTLPTPKKQIIKSSRAWWDCCSVINLQ